MAKNDNNTLSPFMNAVHTTGRISTILTLASFLAAGLLICSHFHYFPTLPTFIAATLPIFVTIFGNNIGDYFASIPMLGPGAAYISYITGNITNMKIPSILGTMRALNVDRESEEYDVLSIIAAAVASILVMIMLAIIVLFSGAIRPILEFPILQPAFSNTTPAIYAILLVGFVRKSPNLCLITSLLIIPVIIFLNPITNNLAGTFASLIISGGAAVLIYRRKAKSQEDQ